MNLIFKIAFLLLITSTGLFAQMDDCIKEETDGYNMLLIGNSFFRPYAEKLDDMAVEAGFDNHTSTTVFRGGENGRPINFWNDSLSIEHHQIKAALDQGSIEYFGMTAGLLPENPTDGFRQWIEYALESNPDITIFLSIPPFDFPEGDTNSDRPDWNTFALENGFNTIQEFYSFFIDELVHNEIVDQLRLEFPSTKIFTIPTGWATFNLNQMNLDGGLLDDIDMFGPQETSIFTDQKGHQGDIVRETGGMIWLNSIYNVDLSNFDYDTGFNTDLRSVAENIVTNHDSDYSLCFEKSFSIPDFERTTEGIVLADQNSVSFNGNTIDLDFYRNNTYDCGLSGKYTFMVVNPVNDPDADAPLWVWFHGGGQGYFDENGVYQSINVLDENSFNHEESFDDLWTHITSRSVDNNGQLIDNTLIRRIREGYRILVLSYSDHDWYSGLGTAYPNNPNPNAQVNGLQASMSAIDYTSSNYCTNHVWLHGTSGGSYGAWSTALSYSEEGTPLTGFITDSGGVFENGSDLLNAYLESGDLQFHPDWRPEGIEEKVGFFAKVESQAHAEAQIKEYDFRATPGMWIVGLEDAGFGTNLNPVPEAIAAGINNNAQYILDGVRRAIDEQENSPHELHFIPGAGHVPTHSEGPTNDLVDDFIDKVLSTDPSFPFGECSLIDTPVVTCDSTYSVILEEGIVYGEGLTHDGTSPTTIPKSLLLDVYYPDNDVDNRPVYFFIHGGGFSGGSRQQEAIVDKAHYFASRGWVFVSIDYRLRGDLGTEFTGIVPDEWLAAAMNIPDPSQAGQFLAMYLAQRDAKAAMRWVVANADNYNINTDFITAGGGSAGAITAITLGVSNLEDFRDEISITDDPTLTTTNLNQTYEIKSILDFWGSNSALEAHEIIYGTHRFDSDDPPLFIAHGTEDPTVLYSEATELVQLYDSTGVYVELNTLEGAGHGAWGATVDGKSLSDLSFDFLVEQQELILEDDCDMSTSILESLDIDVNVFPNPANDVINIDGTEEIIFKTTLYDLDGRVIIASINGPILDTSSLPSGIYLLKIKNIDSGSTIVKRIVIGK